MIRVELTFRNLLLLLGLVLAFWIGYLLRETVVLLSMALMLMATLHPLVKLAERRGMGHGKAVALVMLSLVVVPLGIAAALSPLVISEVQDFAARFPTLQHHIDELLRNWGIANWVNHSLDKLNLQDRIAGIAVVSVQQTISFFIKTFTVIVISGYLLSGSRRLQLVLHEFTPRHSERHIEPLLEGMERVVGGYIRGQILTSALFGVFAFFLCLVLGIPSPLLLGIIAAIGDIIPIFGVPLAMAITVLVALMSSVWQPIGVVVGYVIYGQIESHFLVPRIYSKTINMSPLLVIIATIAGGALDGFVGVLIGIPIVGAMKFILDYIITERTRGSEAAAQAAFSSPTDVVGEENTEEELGRHPDAAAAEHARDGIPEPTYSPFESVPKEEPPPQRLSGARYITRAHIRHHRGHHDDGGAPRKRQWLTDGIPARADEREGDGQRRRRNGTSEQGATQPNSAPRLPHNR